MSAGRPVRGFGDLESLIRGREPPSGSADRLGIPWVRHEANEFDVLASMSGCPQDSRCGLLRRPLVTRGQLCGAGERRRSATGHSELLSMDPNPMIPRARADRPGVRRTPLDPGSDRARRTPSRGRSSPSGCPQDSSAGVRRALGAPSGCPQDSPRGPQDSLGGPRGLHSGAAGLSRGPSGCLQDSSRGVRRTPLGVSAGLLSGSPQGSWSIP